ncbi:MAG TPA: DUF1206 domain-containing protein [Polyangiaceae bacterium]
MQLSSLPAVVSSPQASEPFRFFVKLGYAVKGCVYGLLGVLAFRVGIGDGGRVAGEKEALRHVARQSFGDAALIVIGAGLFFYALWRLVEAVFDPYRVGHSLRGVAQRTAALVSAIGNGAFALTAVQLALGEHGSGRSAHVWASLALREDYGPTLLVVLGALFVSVGLFYAYEAISDKFCEHLDLARSSGAFRKYVLWSGRLGYLARGALFAIIGVAGIRAGQNLDPSEVKDLRQALASLTEQPFGQTLLVAAAAGLLAYALHLVTTAPLRKLGA